MQVGVTITDVHRRIVYVNRAEAESHGYSKDDLLGRDAAILAPEPLRKQPMPPEALRKLRSWKRVSTNLRSDGSTFPVEILSDVAVDAEGDPVGIVTISQDITERLEAERALRESEERFALAVAGANDGIWDWNLETESISFSERWKGLLGFEPGEIRDVPDTWWSRVHPEDLEWLRRELDQHLEGASQNLHNEHRMLHRDGDYRWMLVRGAAIRDQNGKATRIAGSLTDITDRKVHDPLTGLPNRALFLDRLKNALHRGRRKLDRLNAVLFLDLDRFKVVNDSLGHPAGDQLLKNVASVLRASLRPGDTVARIGGDEFLILLEDIESADEAAAIAERIQAELRQPFQVDDEELFTTASIGIALSATGLEPPENLLRDADTAMYQAKARGSGRHRIFDRDMRKRALDQLRIETDLRRALERDEFVLHYQPILRLATDEIDGFEALIRWQHPERGLLAPREFIDAAEETGLILPIGRWVLRTACLQMASWLAGGAEPGWRMSINLSPKQFGHPRLVHDIRETLASASLAPENLQLEITEGTFIENLENAAAMIDSLRHMGIQVAIDDFGTGYSSLGYLDRLPVDILKIDRSFVSKLGTVGGRGEVVRSVMGMAENLHIRVVAEGVETELQKVQLEELQCDFIQGYLHSRPQPAEAIGRLLAQRREDD